VAAIDWISPPKPRRNEPSRGIAAQYSAGQWMHCVKLLDQNLSARDCDRQVAEIQIRTAILNRFTALGIPKTVAIN
jgi:hypothetical protein